MAGFETSTYGRVSAVDRKHLGWVRIPADFAEPVNEFTQNVRSPYLDFHRPRLLPAEEIDARGRRRKRYPCANLMTPYDKLRSLPTPTATSSPASPSSSSTLSPTP